MLLLELWLAFIACRQGGPVLHIVVKISVDSVFVQDTDNILCPRRATLNPVSYTHLDVYKRQILPRESRVVCSSCNRLYHMVCWGETGRCRS